MNIFKSHLLEAIKKIGEELKDVVDDARYPLNTDIKERTKNNSDLEFSEEYFQNQNTLVLQSEGMSFAQEESFEKSDPLEQSSTLENEEEPEQISAKKNDRSILVAGLLVGTAKQGIVLSEIIGPPKGRMYWNRYRKK